MPENQRNSQFLYLLKAFAIFSVVCAHTAVEPENSSTGIHLVVRMLSAIGTMGVPLFFIISGYLYYDNQRGIKDFVLRKCRTIIIPWIFCETIVWLYVVLRKGGITFFAWSKFILGVYHSTYYLTVLMMLYILFWRLKRYEAVLIGSVVISGVCIFCLGWNMSFAVKWSEWTINSYLNIFNWIIYFALGMLLNKRKYMSILAEFSKKVLPVSLLLLLIDFAFHYYYVLPWTYFSKYALINISSQILVVMGICCWLRGKRVEALVELGKYSYTIYLLHELGAGGVVWLTAKLGNILLIIVRPIIVILLVLFGIMIIQRLCKKFEKLQNVPKLLIGIR